MIGYLHLHQPLWLIALIFIPVGWWISVRQVSQVRALLHPAAAWLAEAFHAGSGLSPNMLRAGMALVWTLWCVALAQPQWVQGQASISRHGRDLMLIVDSSGSMDIQDFMRKGERISRLDAIKYVLGSFLEGRSSDRVGLILFGEDAYIQSPLTYDRALVRHLLNAAETGWVGERTAMGTAIGLALKHLQQVADQRGVQGGQVIILLTDGQNNAGSLSPTRAAMIAKTLGVRIYVIGVGSLSPDIIKQADTPFDQDMMRAVVALNEDGLKSIAVATNGKYFRATDSDSLRKIAASINQIEKVEQEETLYFDAVDLYPWFLCAGLLMFFALQYRRRVQAVLP